MPKNIVILLDGTSNEISRDRTNVLRLYGTLSKSDNQLVYYDPGVGTFGSDNSWLRITHKAQEVWGLATGWGLDRNVKQAYRFLMQHYDNGKRQDSNAEDRDQIYIFGFSRGAYTARVLAGFINAIGLLEMRNENLLDYAYRAYKRIGESSSQNQAHEGRAFAEVRLYERLLRPDRPPVRLLGLFDTVSSVIESGPAGPRLQSHAFTDRNTSVQSIFHAVAIDERRTMFQPQLWPDGQPYWGGPFSNGREQPQDVREVWFAGCHGDVGGGYPEAESRLAKIPLNWMIDQAKQTGLSFKTRSINSLVLGKGADSKYAAPDPLAPSHNTMKGAWPLVEFLPRARPERSNRPSVFGLTIPLFERRVIPDGARLHSSVIQRRDERGIAPANLPATFTVDP